ncbi:MAG TPA: hypothetical protein VGN17_30720 [Bryobacteraceae bacterium]|jgi:hypothetical protein
MAAASQSTALQQGPIRIDREKADYLGKSHGWAPLPNSAGIVLPEKLSPLAFSILVHLFCLGQGTPEARATTGIVITDEALAQKFNLSTDAIRYTRAELKKSGVIDFGPRGTGHGRRAGVKYELMLDRLNNHSYLSKLPDREQRKVKRRAADKQTEDLHETQVLAPGKSLRLPSPDPSIELVNSSSSATFSVKAADHRIQVAVAEAQEKSCLVQTPQSNTRTGVQELSSNTRTQVQDIAGRASEDLPARLRAFLQPVFLDLPDIRKQIDDALLGKILRELGGAPIKVFEDLVRERCRSKPWGIKAGLFICIAQDARAAHEEWERQRHLRRPAPPAADVPPTPYEPEDSGTPWMQIRRVLRESMHGTIFANWFEHTAFQEEREGTIFVAVADEIAKAAIDTEYALMVAEAAKKLGITSAVRFVVAAGHGSDNDAWKEAGRI